MEALDMVREVRALADEYPFAVYQSLVNDECWYSQGYVTNGPPKEGCIVGQAFTELVDDALGIIEEVELTGPTDVDGLLEHWDIDAVDAPEWWLVRGWLQDVQSQQDFGSTWGDAVAVADDKFIAREGDTVENMVKAQVAHV